MDAVKAAKGRTSDNLGTKYPKISEPLWTAVQAALSGVEVAAGGADRRADRGRGRDQVAHRADDHELDHDATASRRDGAGRGGARPPRPGRAAGAARAGSGSGRPGPSSPR